MIIMAASLSLLHAGGAAVNCSSFDTRSKYDPFAVSVGNLNKV